jgi:hypothetical protein
VVLVAWAVVRLVPFLVAEKVEDGHAAIFSDRAYGYATTAGRADFVAARSGVGAELRMSDWPFQCATVAVHAWRAWCSHTW